MGRKIAAACDKIRFRPIMFMWVGNGQRSTIFVDWLWRLVIAPLKPHIYVRHATFFFCAPRERKRLLQCRVFCCVCFYGVCALALPYILFHVGFDRSRTEQPQPWRAWYSVGRQGRSCGRLEFENRAFVATVMSLFLKIWLRNFGADTCSWHSVTVVITAVSSHDHRRQRRPR